MESHKLTWSLIVINVLVFLLVFSAPEPVRENIFKSFSFSGSHTLEVWRWITSLFLHASASHLFFNMLGLYFFGKFLEEEVEAKWFLSIYFISGLIGNCVFMLTSVESVVGASGCVFGLMGASMLLEPVKKIHLFVFPLPLALVGVVFVVAETFVIYFQPDFGNIAHYSHIAGLITGSVFAFFCDTRRAVKGLFVIILCLLVLMFLSPVIGMITGIGSFVLTTIDKVLGVVIYTAAGLLSFIW